MSLTLPRQGRTRGHHLVCVYNHISDKKFKRQREKLPEETMHHVEQAPGSSLVITGGDFNSEVGVRDGADWHEVLGPHGNPKRTKTGYELLEHCQAHGWAIADTFTPQTAHGTWTHPRLGSEHFVDHFIVRRRDLWHVRRCHVRSPRPEEAPWTTRTDHGPVEMLLHGLVESGPPPLRWKRCPKRR